VNFRSARNRVFPTDRPALPPPVCQLAMPFTPKPRKPAPALCLARPPGVQARCPVRGKIKTAASLNPTPWAVATQFNRFHRTVRYEQFVVQQSTRSTFAGKSPPSLFGAAFFLSPPRASGECIFPVKTPPGNEGIVVCWGSPAPQLVLPGFPHSVPPRSVQNSLMPGSAFTPYVRPGGRPVPANRTQSR